MGQLRPTFGAALPPAVGDQPPAGVHFGINQHQVTDWLNQFASVNAAKGFPSDDPASTGHVTRLFSPTGPESQALWTTRRPSNRGNAYLPPLAFADPAVGQTGILPAWDCDNAGGNKPATETDPACRTAAKVTFQGSTRQYPQLRRVEYLP